MTGIYDVNEVKEKLILFPNPSNGVVQISYNINAGSYVTLEVYNNKGQKMQSLVNTQLLPGEYNYSFNQKVLHYSAGVYFIRLKVDENIYIKMLEVIH